jgi:hypothetical protein
MSQVSLFAVQTTIPVVVELLNRNLLFAKLNWHSKQMDPLPEKQRGASIAKPSSSIKDCGFGPGDMTEKSRRARVADEQYSQWAAAGFVGFWQRGRMMNDLRPVRFW